MKWIPPAVRRRIIEGLKLWGAFGVLTATGLGIAVSCNPVIMVAPPGSTFAYMAGNPTFISAHGGVAEITALLVESTGVPVADGTVVQFFTDLGRIEEQGRTNDGVVRVKLVADSRSGVAHVRAFSGGGSAPSGTSTATPTGTGTATATPTSGGGGGTTNGQTDITIGNLNGTQVLITADPARITNSRSTLITATVLDAAGNPVPQAPVFFSIVGTPGNERLDSAGQPVFTDNNGQARDYLRTVAINDGNSYPVTVRARTANGTVSPDLVISIN